jgi:ABC-2 type transport system permease protein
MAILPIFILITTVRSVAGDREAGVLRVPSVAPGHSGEPGIGARSIGRFAVVFLPVFLSLVVGASGGAHFKGAAMPWAQFSYYTALLLALSWCFLGIGILISTTQPAPPTWPRGSAFVIWLTLLLFIDLILLGVLIQESAADGDGGGVSRSPIRIQVFRTAAMLLFDPQLVILGPTAYVILDNFGQAGYMAYALIYPMLVGTACAFAGYLLFRRGDLP